MKLNKYIKLIALISVISLGYVLINRITKAQSVSLAITPPIYEILIAPGKEATQSYLLENNGNDTLISVRLVPFSSSDSYGNVKLDDSLNQEQQLALNWFSLEKPSIDFNEQLSLPGGSSIEYLLRISPYASAPEGDYYFTLLFETDSSGLGAGRGSAVETKIGSNILLTVSEDGNPLKIAKIHKFKAPKLIDSFGSLVYDVEITNDGTAFFKPQGDITVAPTFGGIQLLRLTPYNILASTKRVIPCFTDEAPVQCRFQKQFLFGIYKAKLRFQIDDIPRYYETETQTIAFPFVLILTIAIFFTALKVIQKISRKQKISKDNR